ncbi:MAG: DciA family protein [Sulfitobacter sp.]|nr:DciA family protein [Sulfitobacter sp.]
MTGRRASTKGFARTDALLSGQIRRLSEGRGFAQSRLLTQWSEIAGADVAAISRPVEVSYGRGGFGATLTLLTTGAHAPMLEMQKEQLRARVNGIYGYNAIARVRITQTAATGFAEGQIAFQAAPAKAETPTDPRLKAEAAKQAAPVTDTGLREALARLGENILTKEQRRQRADHGT